MLIKESLWVKEKINELNFSKGTKFLNFGAQNNNYLKYQKYIQENVYEPIIKKKYKLINFDLKPGNGIDIYGDLRDLTIFYKLKRLDCECVLLFNVLEHLYDISSFVNLLSKLMDRGDIIMITVPYKFPYHEDPIDNGFRPKPDELIEMFKDFIPLDSKIIIDHKYIFYLCTNYRVLLKFLFRLLTPFYKYKKWKTNILPKLLWMFKNFQVSCVILKKIR